MKWALQWKNKEIFDALQKHFKQGLTYIEGAWTTYDREYFGAKTEKSPENYEEVSFEWFKQNILKEKVHYEIY